MIPVHLAACPDYEPARVRQALARVVEGCGGLHREIHPGDQVLIKPNLLGAYTPEQRVTTDPSLVRAVVGMVLDLGGRPLIADSPALDSFARSAQKSGLAQVAKETGARIEELSQPTPVKAPGSPVFASLEIARQVVESDLVINLPKLKTHSQMLLTLGVKNCFGAVVAQRKAQWHFMAGTDRLAFANLLLDIHAAVAPTLTIMDGVWGMQGLGPSSGSPVHLGLVAASRDALALDLALADLLAVPRNRWPLFLAAQARDLLPQGVELAGDDPAGLALPALELPQLGNLEMVPAWLAGWARRRLVAKPAQRPRDCQACGKCAEICPARAMRLEDRRVFIDYDLCIRCYCCQEVCPQEAIYFKKGLLVRLLDLMGR